MCLYEENSFDEVETDKNKNKNKEIVLVDDSTVYDTSLTEDIYDYARIWTCKFCTFINFGKDIQCELCLTPRLNNFKSSKSEINNNNPNQQTPDHWVGFRSILEILIKHRNCLFVLKIISLMSKILYDFTLF